MIASLLLYPVGPNYAPFG